MIKKLIFLLIPIIGFCQTSKLKLNDIRSINSVEMYKKVMMERGLEKNDEEGKEGVNIIYNDIISSDKISQLSTIYYTENDVCFITFDTNNGIYEDEYDGLFNNVKSNCDYFGIDSSIDTEFIQYDCGDGFKIGFGRESNFSFILKYPKE